MAHKIDDDEEVHLNSSAFATSPDITPPDFDENEERTRYIAQQLAGRQSTSSNDTLNDVQQYFNQDIPHYIWRYVPYFHVMGFVGTLSSNSLPSDDLGDKIDKKEGKGFGFSRASRVLDDHQEYDAMISYTWKTGRIRSWLALCYHFNFVPAVVIPLILGCISWFLLSLITNPCNSKFPPVLYCTNVTRTNNQTVEQDWRSGLPDADEEPPVVQNDGIVVGNWWFGDYIWYGLTILLLFWGMPTIFYGKKMFVDRFCVNQHDPTLNGMGLVNLNRTLARSKQLVCLFDENYFYRIWCAFEVATYQKARRKPDIRFVNVWSGMVLIVVPIFLIVTVTSVVAWTRMNNAERTCIMWRNSHLFDAFCEQASVDLEHKLQPVNIGLFVGFSIIFVYFWWWARKYIRARDILFDQSRNFDVRRAACARDSDKEMLLTAIDLMWGDKDSAEQQVVHVVHESELDLIEAAPGIKDFNAYVRDILSSHVSSRLVDKLRLIPYLITVDWYALYWAMNITGLNFFPLWDERNIIHYPELSKTFQWYAFGQWSPWKFFVHRPIQFYLVGIIIQGLVRIDQKYPLKKWGILVWGVCTFLCVYAVVILENAYLHIVHLPVMGFQDAKSDLQVKTKIRYPVVVAMNVDFTYSKPVFDFVSVIAWTWAVVSLFLVWFLYEPFWSIRLRRRSGFRWLSF